MHPKITHGIVARTIREQDFTRDNSPIKFTRSGIERTLNSNVTGPADKYAQALVGIAVPSSLIKEVTCSDYSQKINSNGNYIYKRSGQSVYKGEKSEASLTWNASNCVSTFTYENQNLSNFGPSGFTGTYAIEYKSNTKTAVYAGGYGTLYTTSAGPCRTAETINNRSRRISYTYLCGVKYVLGSSRAKSTELQQVLCLW